MSNENTDVKNPLSGLSTEDAELLELRVNKLFIETAKLSGLRRKTDYISSQIAEARPEFVFYLKVLMSLAFNDYLNFGTAVSSSNIPTLNALVNTPKAANPPSLVEKIGLLDDPLNDLKTTPIWELWGYTSSAYWVQDWLGGLHPVSGRLFVDILDRDLKIGIGAKSVEKIFPGLLPEFEVMKAAPFSDKKFTAPSAVEVKFDGMRVLVEVTANSVRFLTRTGRDIPGIYMLFSPSILLLRQEVSNSVDLDMYRDGFILDAEVVSGMDFNETISAGRKKYEQMADGHLYVFDILPISVFLGESESLPLSERKAHLSALFKHIHTSLGYVSEVPLTVVNSPAEARQVYQLVRGTNQPGTDKLCEGVIVKALNGLWRNKRHSDWMKIKPCETLDLPIVGFFEGEGKYSNALGGLIVDYNGVSVAVGSGFTDSQRENIWSLVSRNPEEIIGWFLEVEFHEVTPAGSLRHPVAVRLRRDKGQVEF